MADLNELAASYDRSADTLYVTASRLGSPAISREEDAPGVYWRYDRSTGQLVGVTILDFEDYWLPQLDRLIDALAEKFDISKAQASRVLKRVH